MVTAHADPHEPRTVRHLGAYTVMCLMWGSTFLAIRLGNEAVPPLWAVTLRLVIAGTILAAIAAARRIPYPRGASLRGAATFGVLNMGLDLALLYWGETRISSGTAALFFATLPLMTGLFAWLLHVHAFDRVKTLAAIAGLAGVALIFAGEISLGASPLHLGAVWLAATTAALAGVLLKRVPPAPAITTNVIACWCGAGVCFMGSLLVGESQALPVSMAGWWPILYLVLAGNLIAYVLYAWLMTQWTATTVATSALITPVLAVALGAIVRGEAPAPLTYVGGAMVLAGVAVTLFVAGRGRSVPA